MATPVRKTFTTDVSQMQRRSYHITARGLVVLSSICIDWKPKMLSASIAITLVVRKNQSFGNNSGKSQPIRTTLGTQSQVKGRQRLGNYGCDRPRAGDKIGSSDVHRAAGVLSAKRGDILSTSPRAMFVKFGQDTWIHVPSKRVGRDFLRFSI